MSHPLLFVSIRETKTKKNSEPISTFHPLHDVMVDLFYMLKHTSRAMPST
jgi:hypothetical protein